MFCILPQSRVNTPWYYWLLIVLCVTVRVTEDDLSHHISSSSPDVPGAGLHDDVFDSEKGKIQATLREMSQNQQETLRLWAEQWLETRIRGSGPDVGRCVQSPCCCQLDQNTILTWTQFLNESNWKMLLWDLWCSGSRAEQENWRSRNIDRPPQNSGCCWVPSWDLCWRWRVREKDSC